MTVVAWSVVPQTRFSIKTFTSTGPLCILSFGAELEQRHGASNSKGDTGGGGHNCDRASLGMSMFSLEVTDACKWTLVHADGEMSGKPVQP